MNRDWRRQLLLEIHHSRAVVTRQWKYIANRAPAETAAAMQAEARAAAEGKGERTIGWNGLNHHNFNAERDFPAYFDADQLYDLDGDLYERRNLAAAKPDVVADMKKRLSELLTHLYVLVPVLDKEKHYWVGDDEVDKLLRRGEGWLAAHPERELIAHRYLKYQRSLAQEALRRLAEGDNAQSEDEEDSAGIEVELEKPLRLNRQRPNAVVAALKDAGARRVIDLGCGEGRLLKALLADKSFEQVAGMDVSPQALARAGRRLHLDRMPAARRARLTLFQGSLTYHDQRLVGYDAATVVEVVEHLDPTRLGAFERVLFESARPRAVVVTTPNREHNVLFASRPANGLRHPDHRFEWTREEFQAWSRATAQRFGYGVRFLPVGPEDPVAGPPTQMGVFSL